MKYSRTFKWFGRISGKCLIKTDITTRIIPMVGIKWQSQMINYD